MKKYLPSIITSLNLALGFIAILINNPFWSPVLILTGALFDLFDGLAARLLNAVSDFGKQIDSLADLVTFGVAPAYLYYQYMLPHTTIGVISASFIPVCGALRLARYNISTDQSVEFKGLPIPGNGIFFISFPFLLTFSKYNGFVDFVKIDWISIILPIMISIFMISTIKMFSFKKLKDLTVIIFIILTVLSVVIFQWIAVPFLIIMYIFISVIKILVNY